MPFWQNASLRLTHFAKRVLSASATSSYGTITLYRVSLLCRAQRFKRRKIKFSMKSFNGDSSLSHTHTLSPTVPADAGLIGSPFASHSFTFSPLRLILAKEIYEMYRAGESPANRRPSTRPSVMRMRVRTRIRTCIIIIGSDKKRM